MTIFKDLIVKLELYKNTGEHVNNLALFVQYYNFVEQKWINLFRSETENGLFYIKSSAKSTVKSKAYFFELVRNEQIPPIRIVPTEKLFHSKKKEVIGTTFSFSLNQNDSTFEFDFGTLWLVPKEWTYDSTDVFRDFTTIASLFPPKNFGIKIPDVILLENEKTEMESYQQELELVNSNLKTLTSQYQTLYASNEELKKNHALLKEQKAALDNNLVLAKSDLKKQESYVQQLETKITDLSKETSSENTSVPIKNLYSDIITEIETANKFTESSSFRLSNISLKLKAIIQKEGDTLSASLMDLSNSGKVNGNSISEMVFDITPVRNTEVAPGKMPDVIGLTETAVRRILKSIDLRLNPVYQNNRNVVNGDSFKQSPAPGNDFQANQLITVIFSKHEQ
jgi:hypothetical protein